MAITKDTTNNALFYELTGTNVEAFKSDTTNNAVGFNKDNRTIIAKGVEYGTTSKPILVAGGPLANDVDDNWPDAWKSGGNKQIPAGTSLTEVLEKLLLKEINGSCTGSWTDWNPSVSAPSASIKDANGNVITEAEVGTKVNVSFAQGLITAGNREWKLTADQGYFEGDGTTWNDVASNKVMATVTGSAGAVGAVTATWNNNSVETASTVTVGADKNTLLVSQADSTASLPPYTTTTYYYASTNTKTKLDTPFAYIATIDVGVMQRLGTQSAKAEITGYRKLFMGGCSTATPSSLDIRALTKSAKNAKGTYTLTAKNGAKNLVIACPKGTRTITSILNVKASNAECKDGFIKQTSSVSVLGNNDFAGADYDVWVYAADANFDGTETFTVTLS